MIAEDTIINLLGNYFYFVLSALIGYIFWHKIYNVNNREKIKNNVDNLLRWINLSVISFLSFFILGWTIFLSLFVIDNTIIDISNFLKLILGVLNYVLGFIVIYFSALLINVNITEKEFRTIVIYFGTLFFIGNISIFLFAISYKTIINYFYFIPVFLALLGLFFITHYNFNVRVYKKERIKFWSVLSLFLLFSILILWGLSNNFTNKIELENENIKKIVCNLDYSYCKIIYFKNYSVYSKHSNYYNFDYLNENDKFNINKFKIFFNNGSKEFFYLDESNIDKNNNLKIIKFDKTSGELAFELNNSIKYNITNIRVELIDDNNVYPRLKPFKLISNLIENNTKLNFSIFINTSYIVEIHNFYFKFSEKENINNCSFQSYDLNLDKFHLNCNSEFCYYANFNETRNNLNINLDEQRNEFFFDTNEFDKNINLILPVKCNLE